MLSRTALLKDYCWVCNERFKTSSPPGLANRQDHHIFPRNAGGDDGPLVSLCDRDHSTVHKLAERLHRKGPVKDLLFGVPDPDKRLCWLAACIVKAEKLVANDPNKLLRSSIQLTRQEAVLVNRLKTVYPTKSKEDIFKLGIVYLYKKHFH